MTAITTGSGSTFKNATAEGHLLEVITYLQSQELNISSNPTNRDCVQISYNLNNMTAVCSFAVPVIQAINDVGQIVTTGVDYLQGIIFSPGSGGTFKSPTLTQYFLEIIGYVQTLEDNPIKNSQATNNVFYSTDGDDKITSGTVNIPLSVSFDELGQPLFTAKEYLL